VINTTKKKKTTTALFSLQKPRIEKVAEEKTKTKPA